MAVKIRLRRMGAKKSRSTVWWWPTAASPRRPFHRGDRHLRSMREPAEIKIDAEKAKAWIANGAQPTDTVRYLLKKSEIL